MSERIETFTNRLNQAMAIRNLKQVDLIQMTGLRKQKMSQYVNGQFEAKQEALYKLAQALNVNEAWLMGYDVPMERVLTPPSTTIDKWEEQHNSKGRLTKEITLDEIGFAFHQVFDKLDEGDKEELLKDAEKMLELAELRRQVRGE